MRRVIDFFANAPFLISFLIIVAIVISSISTLFSFSDYQYARTSVDKVRQFYVDQFDKQNTYDVDKIPINNTEIKNFLTSGNGSMISEFGDIKIEIETDKGSKNQNTGYLGRTFKVIVSREVKNVYTNHSYTVKSVGTVVNRGQLVPSKDITYEIGDEFYSTPNGANRQ